MMISCRLEAPDWRTARPPPAGPVRSRVTLRQLRGCWHQRPPVSAVPDGGEDGAALTGDRSGGPMLHGRRAGDTHLRHFRGGLDL